MPIKTGSLRVGDEITLMALECRSTNCEFRVSLKPNEYTIGKNYTVVDLAPNGAFIINDKGKLALWHYNAGLNAFEKSEIMYNNYLE